MSNMGFSSFYEGGDGVIVCYVAPKSDYKKEDFFDTCVKESDGYHELGEVKEGYCRWYPNAPEGIDLDGGCYSFCKEGKGAFPVWYVDIE
ncbi:MAG TPA: hypothetical protein IAA29_11925 [Candidatus Paenibacillus intestinavium]|nr:hypothetical protein [Candidatus Paenibacillus intestinavium]